jgi:hypothetical protein
MFAKAYSVKEISHFRRANVKSNFEWLNLDALQAAIINN